MKYAVSDLRSAEHWSAIRDSLVQATGSRWAADLIRCGRQGTSLPPVFWFETLSSFLFFWNAFTPQQYYSLLVVPSLLLSSLKLKLLCIFPKNIFFFFSHIFLPCFLKGKSVKYYAFLTAENVCISVSKGVSCWFWWHFKYSKTSVLYT